MTGVVGAAIAVDEDGCCGGGTFSFRCSPVSHADDGKVGTRKVDAGKVDDETTTTLEGVDSLVGAGMLLAQSVSRTRGWRMDESTVVDGLVAVFTGRGDADCCGL